MSLILMSLFSNCQYLVLFDVLVFVLVIYDVLFLDNAKRFSYISTLEEYFTVIIWDLVVLALNMFTNV